MKKLLLILILILFSSFASAITLQETTLSYYKEDINNSFDDTIGLYNGTISGATFTTNGKINNAYSFDGINDQINFISRILTAPYSINFWVKLNDLSDFEAIAGLNTDTNNQLNLDPTIPRIFIEGNVNGDNAIWTYNNFTTTEYEMFTFTAHNSTSIEAYVNGLSLGKMNMSNTTFKLNTFGIARNDGVYYLNGTLDEFGIFNISLSQPNINKLYYHNIGNQYPYYPYIGENFSMSAIDYITSLAIYNFSALINGTTYYSNITTAEIKTDLNSLSPTLFNITVFAPNYLSKTYLNYNISAFLQARLRLLGQYDIFIRDQYTLDLITQKVDINIYHNETKENYSTSTGEFLYTFNEDEYLLEFISDNYTTRSYYYNFTYVGNLSNTVYLLNTSNIVSFIVTDIAGLPLNDALITIEAFINGTLQVVGSKKTDIIGKAKFPIPPDTQHRITISKENYITQIFNIDTTETEYTVRLQLDQVFTFESGITGIGYNYAPTNTTLKPSIVPFSFYVNATTGDITYLKITIFNGSTIVGNIINSSLPYGGTINLNFNTTPYNNTFLEVYYSYKRVNYEIENVIVTYRIEDRTLQHTGSLLGLHNFAKENLKLSYKLILFTLILLISTVILASLGVRSDKIIIGLTIFSYFIAFGLGFDGFMFTLMTIIYTILYVGILGGIKRRGGG